MTETSLDMDEEACRQHAFNTVIADRIEESVIIQIWKSLIWPAGRSDILQQVKGLFLFL